MDRSWKDVRRLFARAFRSSQHYALATVGHEGQPHITPIGSVILREPGHAIYFEEFSRSLPRNLAQNPRVCILAVRTGLLYWLAALLRGRFRAPPALRLHGVAGPTREATPDELASWQRRVRWVRGTRGYDLLWSKMRTVRDVKITSAVEIQLGAMTRDAWTKLGAPSASESELP